MSESCLFRYLKKIGLSVLITMAFVMNGLIGSVITACAENTMVSESNKENCVGLAGTYLPDYIHSEDDLK